MVMTETLPNCLKKFESMTFHFCVDHNEGNWKMPFEWHDAMEIFYVLEGKGQYFIENKFYSFEKGSLFVISNNELHKSQIRPGEHFKVVVIMFDPSLLSFTEMEDGFNPLSIFYDHPPHFSHQLDTDWETSARLERIFLAIQEEYERVAGFSMRVISSYLQCLMVEISRAYREKTLTKGTFRKQVQLKEIVTKSIDFVETHLTDDIKLTQVANEIGVSATYLSTEFKKETGISFIDYLSVKRIQLAKDYLRTTDWQVTDIAFRIGYKNVTHFNFVFKKLVGKSPSQFRKLAVNGN
jgi:AraC-like DNA-binding protein